MVVVERLTCHVGIWRQPFFPDVDYVLFGVVGLVENKLNPAWAGVGAELGNEANLASPGELDIGLVCAL